jgi:hypothetical protein
MKDAEMKKMLTNIAFVNQEELKKAGKSAHRERRELHSDLLGKMSKGFKKLSDETVNVGKVVIADVNQHTDDQFDKFRKDNVLFRISSWVYSLLIAIVAGIGSFTLFLKFGYEGIGPFARSVSLKAVSDAAGNVLTYVPAKYAPVMPSVWLCTGLSTLAVFLISLAIIAAIRSTKK